MIRNQQQISEQLIKFSSSKVYKVVYQCYDNNIKTKKCKIQSIHWQENIRAHTRAGYIEATSFFSLHLSPTGLGKRSPARSAWLVISLQWDWWSVVVDDRCQCVRSGLPLEDGPQGHSKSLHWKLALGEKSLAAPGTWTGWSCLSFRFRRF